MSLEGVGSALGASLERALVAFDETAGLVAESESQALQPAELDALAENDGGIYLVESGGKLFVADHLADNSGHLAVRELEHGGEGANGKSVVEWRIGEEVSTETLLLNLL